ncbi:MAG: DNA translocase FtsK [bacterium]|nr:DNA translocase FtsK [bacterium]MDZ4231728.1 DNA translocase FtsK [Candidatus Pacearchaeota archaeon]
MARRKKKSKTPKLSRLNPQIPERALRLALAVLCFSLALIFLFAFFDKAGGAGQFLFSALKVVTGNVVYVFPLLFFLLGLVLVLAQEGSKKPVFLAFALLILSAVGVLGVIHGEGTDALSDAGGWLGFLAAWPLLKLFGVWVAGIILGAVGVIALVIFWQMVPHQDAREVSMSAAAGEKIRKIFEPKFEVEEVEPEEEGEPAPAEQKRMGRKKEEAIPIYRLTSTSFKLPPSELLESGKGSPNAGDVKVYSALIKKTLANFGIPVEMSEINIGPAVTQYAFKPAEGVKLSRITALANDMALALAAHPLRIEAPIPGRALVGVEVPNKVRAVVRLRELVEHPTFKNSPSPLLLAFGRDVSGAPVFADLNRMPHLLVAGATGAGKTIFLSNIILSLLFRNTPETLRLILVDPKRVEFPVYNGLPHLLTPVILDTTKTINMLKWLVKEMERRFEVLSAVRKRDIGSYHVLAAEKKAKGKEEDIEPMPYIVVVIDELADLMASRGKDIEGLVVRIAQMARAVGIHLVIATQRPSVEVLTGLIKANITSRAAFQVASQIDSRTILDAAGAEKLLGQGDMLFLSAEFSKPKRIQGAYVSDKDVKEVSEWIEKESEGVETERIGDDELSRSAEVALDAPMGSSVFDSEDDDPMYEEAKRVVIESEKASASLLQRRLKLGYARAARLLDVLEARGVVGPADGAKPREVFTHAENVEGDDEEAPNLTEEEGEEWVSPVA